jgi:chemotaxis protein methyltransferase CheR
MRETIPEALLRRLSQLIESETALSFPRRRWDELEEMVLSASREFGADGLTGFIERLLSAPLSHEQMGILASHLTIGETYFWREPQTFEALENRILPGLARGREGGGKKTRVWSVGCATGEEPYSIAMALRRAFPSHKAWETSILATDINAKYLRQAADGRYGEWSFRNAPPWLAKQFFLRGEDGQFAILPEIRDMVSFAYLNLADDGYPSATNGTNAMDIIFCRNVLMYFSAERAGLIVRRLYDCLAEGGWLLVGASEPSGSLFSCFTRVRLPGGFAYRKVEATARPVAACRPEAWLARAGRTQLPSDAGGHGERGALCRAKAEVRALADRGILEDALRLCKEAVASDKLDSGLRYLEASILLELNREEEAIQALDQALYLDPDFILAHFTRGNLAARRGDPGTERRSFENALSLLARREDKEVLPESEGLTAGRLREIIRAALRMEAPA